jgi:hypothetical protein
MIISLRGGEEDEKKKQPDSEEEKKMTAISFCSMDGVTPPFERAMLYGAREAIVSYSSPAAPHEQRFSLPHPRRN